MFFRSRRAKALSDTRHQHELHCTSLCCAKIGQNLCVTQLCGAEGECAKLRELGVREGANVTILRHSHGGHPILIAVDGARFGIGQSAATQVLCDIVAPQSS